jgi:hypothetical protein
MFQDGNSQKIINGASDKPYTSSLGRKPESTIPQARNIQLKDQGFDDLSSRSNDKSSGSSSSLSEPSCEVPEPSGEVPEPSGEVSELSRSLSEPSSELSEPSSSLSESSSELSESSSELSETSSELSESDSFPACPSDDEKDVIPCHSQIPFQDYSKPPFLHLLGQPKKFLEPIAEISYGDISINMYHYSFMIGRTRSPHNTEVDLNLGTGKYSKRHILIRFEKTSKNYYMFVIKPIGKYGILVNNKYIAPDTETRCNNLTKPLNITIDINDMEKSDSDPNVILKPILSNINKVVPPPRQVSYLC